MITLELKEARTFEEGDIVQFRVEKVEKRGEGRWKIYGEELKPVPVNDKLAEAFRAIRYNFRMRERIGNILRSVRETRVPGSWAIDRDNIIKELQELLDRLDEVNADAKIGLKNREQVLYKEDLECQNCRCDADCNGRYLFLPECHPGPVWAEYSPVVKGESNHRGGVVVIRCADCGDPIIEIAVASRKFYVASQE